MVKATFKGQVLAESEDTKLVEGNHYFPPESVKMDFFSDSETDYECPWKGHADYYHLEVNGEKVADAAWYYPEPSEAAKQIAGHVAFDTAKGIEISEE